MADRAARTRIASLDAFRVPAILAIICLHALPFVGPAFQDSLAQAMRAVINHPLFIRLLQPVEDRLASYAWELTFPFIVYGLSLALVLAMARHRALRRIVV